MSLVSSRSLRKDAVHSRGAILAAAGQCRAAGREGSYKEIARAAGVGLATVYRHFPNRQDLLLALIEQAVERIEEAAQALSTDDPGTFGILLRTAVGEQAHCQGLTSLLSERESTRAQIDSLTRRVRSLFEEPLIAARAAGAVRPDFALDEVVMLSEMIDGALGRISDPSARGQTAARALEFLLEGIGPNRTGQS
jgi:AcrR family transcriptional regulator